MSRFWRVFAAWFATLMLFFVATNLAGFVRPMGLKPFRVTGFPYTVSARGAGVEEFFDRSALALNVVVAVGASGLVALVCVWARGGRVAVPGAEVFRRTG
jgi:hypothetical protein